MRLPRPHFGRPAVPWPVLVVLAAAVSPADLHAALASAAGTLFEAAPFVLAAEVLPRRFNALLASAGCGCRGGRLPGAISLPATALCWLAFGPFVALARVTAGAALAKARLGRGGMLPAPRPAPDAFADLTELVVPALLASLGGQFLIARGSGLGVEWFPLVALAGAAIGTLVPCATAGVAIAAGLAHSLPAAAGGILVTAGLFELHVPAPARAEPAAARAAGTASVLLALALAAIVCRGPAGLVNPRLLPLDGAAAVVAIAGLRGRRTATRAAPAIGAGLLCALAGGYALPQSVASETTVATAFPGQRIDFLGVAHVRAGATTLQRFAIACCRLDATPVALRLTLRLAVPDGAWVRIRGRFVRAGAALLVEPAQWQAVPAPADPFVYR